jgi:large subunit ribosomal protein L23
MALFGKKKSAGTPRVAKDSPRELSRVIVRPIITEKAARLGDQNVYAFEIAKSATKRDVSEAVQKLWKVVPAKVRIVNKVARPIFIRAKNRMGVASGMKKAYVHLAKGDKIELV